MNLGLQQCSYSGRKSRQVEPNILRSEMYSPPFCLVKSPSELKPPRESHTHEEVLLVKGCCGNYKECKFLLGMGQKKLIRQLTGSNHTERAELFRGIRKNDWRGFEKS